MTYSAKEIRRALNEYHELQEVKGVSGHGLHVLCVMADLDRAIKRLPKDQFHALVTYVFGVSSRTAAELLGVSHVTVQNRTEAAIAWIVRYLNEGSE